MVATTLKMGMSSYQIVLSTKFKSFICDQIWTSGVFPTLHDLTHLPPIPKGTERSAPH